MKKCHCICIGQNIDQHSFTFADLSIDLMDTETKKIGKHYQLPLPFKNSTLSLPNNRKVAEKPLTSLKNQFLRDSKYWSDYKLFIQDLLTKTGYARTFAGAPAEGKCWYIY